MLTKRLNVTYHHAMLVIPSFHISVIQKLKLFYVTLYVKRYKSDFFFALKMLLSRKMSHVGYWLYDTERLTEENEIQLNKLNKNAEFHSENHLC